MKVIVNNLWLPHSRACMFILESLRWQHVQEVVICDVWTVIIQVINCIWWHILWCASYRSIIRVAYLHLALSDIGKRCMQIFWWASWIIHWCVGSKTGNPVIVLPHLICKALSRFFDFNSLYLRNDGFEKNEALLGLIKFAEMYCTLKGRDYVK